MKRHTHLIVIATVVILILLLYSVIFTVSEGTPVLVYRLGAFNRIQTEAGPGWKLPFPFETIQAVDTRLRLLEVPARELPTKDNKNLVIPIAVDWKVTDPRLYTTTLTSDGEARAKIQERVADSTRSLISSEYNLGDIFNTHPGHANAFRAMEEKILARLQADLKHDAYGIQVMALRIQSIGLPETASEKVHMRMIAEQERQAEAILAEGDKEANVIRVNAEHARSLAINEAEAEARTIRGEGDAAAAEHFAVFKKNPKLANFLRRLDAHRILWSQRTTVVLPTEKPLESVIEQVPDLAGGGN